MFSLKGSGALSAIIFIKVYWSEVRGILRFMKGCQTGKVVHLYLLSGGGGPIGPNVVS